MFRFPEARGHDPAVDQWFAVGDPLRGLLQPWFDCLRAAGPDVTSLIHDGRPTLCAGDAAFAYLDSYARHAGVGFCFGAFLDDPTGLLEGAGLRHVKLRPERMPDAAALSALIACAYSDVCARRGEG